MKNEPTESKNVTAAKNGQKLLEVQLIYLPSTFSFVLPRKIKGNYSEINEQSITLPIFLLPLDQCMSVTM